jgi:single-strand DNA-binding protein
MINKVILVGRVGNDAETLKTNKGMSVAKFRLATSTKNKDNEDITEWHAITSFSKLADVCESYIKKGMLVYVEGSLKTSEWQDKNGARRFTTNVVASQIKFLSSPKTKWSNSSSYSQRSSGQERVPGSDDDIPF